MSIPSFNTEKNPFDIFDKASKPVLFNIKLAVRFLNPSDNVFKVSEEPLPNTDCQPTFIAENIANAPFPRFFRP